MNLRKEKGALLLWNQKY